jgi:predicted MFS family arabinose efflux permease
VILKPLTAAVIAGYGWRGAFVFLALLPLVIALPIAWWGLREKTDAKASAPGGPVIQVIPEAAGQSFREAMLDWRFWIIGLFILPVAFAISGQISNLEIILTSRGAERSLILSTVPFLGLAIIAGRLIGGWLIDQFWAPAVTVVLLTIAALGAWLLVHGSISYGSILFSVVAMGIAAGVEFDIVSFLTARYFGTRNYGSIYGMLYAFFAVGSGTAPYIFGRIFDATKSYESIVTVGVIALFVPSLLLLFLGRYRFRIQASKA